MARRDTQKLSLPDFFRFVAARYKEARECHHAAEAVRQRLADAFRQEMAEWQEVFGVCYPQLAERRRELPPDFVLHIDSVEQDELQKLRDEIARLEREIEEGRQESDRLLEAAQSETQRLRRTNPEMNRREEELQALMVRYQDEYAEAYERAEELLDSSLGWLKNLFELQRLRRQQRAAKRKQEETLAKLRLVRQEWLDQVQKAGETQAQLRARWQEVGVAVADATTRRDHLTEHLSTLGEQNALQRVLEELSDPPDVDGEFGQALKDLARRNAVRADYEEALEVSAEFLGRAKGIADGLERFGSSLENVVREQRRYGLRQVHVRLGPEVLRMLGSFAELRPKLSDAARLAANPREFTILLRPYNETAFTDQRIRQLFETMGDELSRATAAWG